ncbi:hypothetical protein DCAR_0934981 [Daucus carota subsp. sativus]|uniref:Ubiquitin-like protease family profile domain-containing protein n=1 Tax=Daucus carota subsp. sativus TaxID=79200 RepID=A0AAF1BDJ1_DAUCS|nr:hypothetical protein DCAR_0934981 [Daucus carota subsp. sativus]
MAGTRSGGKKYKFKSSRSAKHGKSQKRLKQNSDDEVEEQLSTAVFDDYWRQKVFSSRYVFIPMCQSNHWNLLIICNIGEDMNSETKSPCIFLLDSLQFGEATRLETKLREFVFHLYESGNRKESVEEIFNIPYNIPSIPQQEDGTKYGYYMLFYMFKFLTACPYQFDMSKDCPGFMNEDWFDLDEFQKFYEDLTSVKEKEFSLSDTTTDKKKDGEGSSIQNINNVNHDMLQTPPSHDLFKSNDALPALVKIKRAKKRKNVKEEEEETEEEEPTENIRKPETDMPNKILLRAYPKTFTDAIQALTEDQKKWDEMLFHDQRVKITEQDVADTLGLPKGEKEICFEKGKVNRDKFSRWRAQFPDKDENRITELTVYEAITRSRVVDLHFKQNFMILMMNLFIYTNNSSFLCQDVLGFEDEFENASQYNWCKLVIESLRTSHEEWWDDPHKKYYTGSLVFLLFFYLGRSVHTEYRAERTRHVFIGWRDSLIENRNRSESIDGTFLKGEIVGPLHNENTGERQTTKNVSLEQQRHQDGNQDDEEAAIFELRKIKGKLPAEDFVDIFQEGDNLKTPKETLRGVEMSPQLFKEAEINTGIMFVTRDINFMYEDNEIITEEKCKNNLKMANDLFPNNPSLKLYEDTFAKMYQPPNQEEEEEEHQSDRDPEWPYCTNKDWKTIDILALPKFDKAYNKMIDIDDFLGDLTLGGERIDFDRFEREEDNEYIPGRLRREVKVGDSQKSPYLDRTIDFNRQKITKAEEEVWNWIIGDTSDPTGCH